jgi:hypothetical protein
MTNTPENHEHSRSNITPGSPDSPSSSIQTRRKQKSLLDQSVPFVLLAGIVLILGLVLMGVIEQRKKQRQVKLKWLLIDMGLAAHNYHDNFNKLPSSTRNEDGVLMHSWQTGLLPFMGGKTIYDSISLSEPWDSESNKNVFETRILNYERPNENLNSTRPSSDQTNYALTSFSANNQVIDFGPGTKFKTITDGLANTILFGEIREGYPAWGKPGNGRDPRIGLNVTGGFGGKQKDVVGILMADGASKFLNEKIDPKVLEALTTPAGGESAPEEF